jgi:stearoyl-CoA desaturase (delta-9 desaturase)
MSRTNSLLARLRRRLGFSDSAGTRRINWSVARSMLAYHILALLACVPWFFSWSGLACAAVAFYLFGVLGINVGYHRLLTHRGFTCPRWLEHTLAVLGACSAQGTPILWVAIHRMHHQHSDETDDPHSPRSGFLWSHMGWFLIHDPAKHHLETYARYARDLFQDRFYKLLERPRVRRIMHLSHWAAFAVVGALVGVLTTWDWLGTLQLSLSWLIWGVFVRTVVHLHCTWAVNSVTHRWGYRNFNTQDDSRNHWLVALVSNGEGWHNNHHAEPRCAAHGRRWWEFDVSYRIIQALELVGLAGNVVKPQRRQKLNSRGESRPAA